MAAATVVETLLHDQGGAAAAPESLWARVQQVLRAKYKCLLLGLLYLLLCLELLRNLVSAPQSLSLPSSPPSPSPPPPAPTPWPLPPTSSSASTTPVS